MYLLHRLAATYNMALQVRYMLPQVSMVAVSTQAALLHLHCLPLSCVMCAAVGGWLAVVVVVVVVLLLLLLLLLLVWSGTYCPR